MHKCNKCGREFEGNFCPDCGTGFTRYKNCPDCGAQLSHDAKFCNECGYSVDGALAKSGGETTAAPHTHKAPSKLYVLARRAMGSKDYAKAENYYSQILLENPYDWEAAFYSVLAGAIVYSGKYPEGAFGKLDEGLTPVCGLIKNAFPDKGQQCEKLYELVAGLDLFIQNYYSRTNAEGRHSSRGTTYIRNTLWTCGDNIAKTFGDGEEFNKIAVELWKRGVKEANGLLDYMRKCNTTNSYYYAQDGDFKTYVTKINRYNEKIKQKDPSYIPPPPIKSTKSGCYVATCVYGSYDCAEVWTLRRYRDDTLAATRRGRAFIRFYYALSPTVVKLFGKQKWFHKLFKKKLDKKVERLQKQGVASTPYKDKDWK